MNLVLVVAYDGTGYCGFQRQRPRGAAGRGGRPSVQERLEEALERLFDRPVVLAGAGRTDAGVHAEMQVVSLQAETAIPPDRLPYAINRWLPDDIVVTGAAVAPAGFHARFSAKSKTYRYSIWRARFPSPFLRRYTWHYPGPLDLAAMAEAASYFCGRQDFAAFQAAGSRVRDTVRTVRRCDLTLEGDVLQVRVEADGFLYKMVRTMVGTLVEVGRGRWGPEEVRRIIASRDRRRAGPAAPPQGLCLEMVEYGAEIALPPTPRSRWYA